MKIWLTTDDDKPLAQIQHVKGFLPGEDMQSNGIFEEPDGTWSVSRNLRRLVAAALYNYGTKNEDGRRLVIPARSLPPLPPGKVH